METWPVAERCHSELAELLPTHDICPLEAFEEDGTRIPPHKYEAKLKGAIVEVYLAFCHHNIKQQKKHIFQAVLQRLVVLHQPVAMPTSPFKCQCITAGSLKSRKGKKPACQ